ncbi:hypothetical protein PoB_001955000 [Plakobranchus ocellatus]|uniref:Secreted protein n=1 Tax=Plakobranchus ocellatus TaxID=259542 RepID=A0AAV3ZD26_9GAST|nr:hypothetical protein PoB_001955000 [Plakobranchus ocellatus]
MCGPPEAYTLPSPVFCLLLHLFYRGLRPSSGVRRGTCLSPQHPNFLARRSGCGLPSGGLGVPENRLRPQPFPPV